MFRGTPIDVCLRLTVICFILRYNVAQTGTCGRKDKVQMTVMSFKSKDAGNFSAQPLPHFECYLGAGEDDAAVTSSRAYNTGNNVQSTMNGIQISGLPANTPGYFFSFTPANSNAFGVFNCTAKKDDREDTTIMTIFLLDDEPPCVHEIYQEVCLEAMLISTSCVLSANTISPIQFTSTLDGLTDLVHIIVYM